MSTITSTELSTLSYAKYGKTAVRVFRIVREGKWHHIVEYNVAALLEGEIETSYTKADNSVVVATDSNLAKISPHILSAEKFAVHLGTFFVSKYAHIHKAHVDIEQLRWTRIEVPGEQKDVEEHSHAFWRDGEEKRTVSVVVDATAGKDKLTVSVSAGISGLLGDLPPVLKSTGSAFEDFYRDEFTTLVPVDDRIFSTSVDLVYKFKPFAVTATKDEKKFEFDIPIKASAEGYDGSVWDESIPVKARKATLEVFALDESASVQATLYKMGQRIIAENQGVEEVTYTLPNQHYVPVDMRYIGVDNLTPCVVYSLTFTFSLFISGSFVFYCGL
ncbi:Uricase [Leucoagaricus sp. SymC.cos]|nr:Uricase [Leucoagaricus sp. SymC.cos]